MAGTTTAVDAKKGEEEQGAVMKAVMQVVEHVMEPGSSLTQRMQYIINGIFAVLLLSITLLIFVDETGSIHPKVMLGLLAGLAVSTNWFFSIILDPEFQAAQQAAEAEAAKEKEEGESKKDK
eukprot:TRINITY_DN6312_c0_g5_i1.p6 TRINITY_DN6312_c0_g5~~TRINITY_DN6312_c0_g5_i1.p6  ORF type:complete len:138 (+),score=55.88 TRINITY_DN6312_c0_g5_i1:51-416(+)